MNNPPTTTPPATNQYKLSNAASIVAASGYNKEVSHLYSLSKNTRNNYLFQGVRNTTVRNSGKTTLMAAVISGNLPEVQRILRDQGHRKEFVNKQVKSDNYGSPRTALDFALESYTSIYKYRSKNWTSPAYQKEKNDRLRIFQILVRDPNIDITVYLLNRLLRLWTYNYPDLHNLLRLITQKLLNTQRTNIDSPFFKEILAKKGLTKLLISAIENNYVDLVQIIVEQLNADVNDGNDQLLPLYRAIITGNQEIIQYLIQRGANIHILDNDSDSFLVAALRSDSSPNQKLKLLKYLIEDVGIKDIQNLNKAFIYEATGNKNTEILNYLVSKGATPSTKKGGKRKTRKNKSKKRKASRRSNSKQ